MKCPRKQKNCVPSFIYQCKNGNFICSCIAKKGSKYKKDIIWFCIKGQLSHTEMEMTPHEAALMGSVLSSSVANTLPQILKRK